MRIATLLLVLGGAARADATFRIERLEDWQDMGNGHGAVRLEVAGIRLDAKEGATASAKVPSHGTELVEATVWLGSKRLRPPFLLEIEDGHEYLVEADPCCFLRVSDIAERSRRAARLRVTGEAEISVEDSEAERFGRDYRPLPLGRESPVELMITPKNGSKFAIWVLLRHEHRYTLVLGDKPKIVRDR